MMAVKRSKNIILGVTASIAIYRACEVARSLCHANINVSVIMTKNAAQLISPKVFSSLTAGAVFPWPFSERQTLSWEIEHISFAKTTDLILIAPATANIIGKIANGIADDLLTTTVMATTAPVLIAPAMNANMYKNKIVQANIHKLKESGYVFVGPKSGRLACGDVGIGHLADEAEIIAAVKRALR